MGINMLRSTGLKGGGNQESLAKGMKLTGLAQEEIRPILLVFLGPCWIGGPKFALFAPLKFHSSVQIESKRPLIECKLLRPSVLSMSRACRCYSRYRSATFFSLAAFSLPSAIRYPARHNSSLVHASQLRFGQPLHETHPHLLGPGERESSQNIDLLDMKRF